MSDTAGQQRGGRGWYRRDGDPPGVNRWWSGTQWTERTTAGTLPLDQPAPSSARLAAAMPSPMTGSNPAPNTTANSYPRSTSASRNPAPRRLPADPPVFSWPVSTRGGLASLFDLDFRAFSGEGLTRLVYAFALIAFVFGWFVWTIIGFFAGPLYGLAILIGGGVSLVVYVGVLRLGLEAYLALIRIAVDIRALRHHADS